MHRDGSYNRARPFSRPARLRARPAVCSHRSRWPRCVGCDPGSERDSQLGKFCRANDFDLVNSAKNRGSAGTPASFRQPIGMSAGTLTYAVYRSTRIGIGRSGSKSARIGAVNGQHSCAVAAGLVPGHSDNRRTLPWPAQGRRRRTSRPELCPVTWAVYLGSLFGQSLAYWRYCWIRVVRRPARPWRSIEYCHARNSSTVSV